MLSSVSAEPGPGATIHHRRAPPGQHRHDLPAQRLRGPAQVLLAHSASPADQHKDRRSRPTASMGGCEAEKEQLWDGPFQGDMKGFWSGWAA